MSAALRIGILAPAPVPAVEGGAERLWRSLANGLIAAGHQAEVVTLPFPETTLQEVVDGYRAFRSADVSRFDVVITGKYPAWMVDHPCHIVYMLHPLRGLYDTYPGHLEPADLTTASPALEAIGAGHLGAIDNPDQLLDEIDALLERLGPDHELNAHPSPLGRAAVHRLDELAFAGDRIRHFAAISAEVAGRPDYFPAHRAVQVAHPVSDLPLGAAQQRGADDDQATYEGPTFFTASRHDAPKRIDLIIRAFRRLTDGHNDRQLTLAIAGDGPERANLEREAGGNERIEFLGRISEEDLAVRYTDSDATIFLPLQEDFGYISLESMLAATPVITTTDAGGANELISHDTVGGIVVEPTVEALADAIDRLADDPYRRWQLGVNGQRRASAITWEPLVRSIEAAVATRGTSTTRPSVVMVSTFGIEPAIGGGQRRVRHLARALARQADVTVLALVGPGSGDGVRVSRRVIEPGITLVEIPRSPQHLDAEAEITRIAGFPIDDITCGRLWEATPAFGTELRSVLNAADVVVSSHPFLAPAIDAALKTIDRPIRFVYDSHNAETPFKAAMLDDSAASPAARRWLIDAVTEAESTAVRLADHVSACTDDDLNAVLSLDPGTGADSKKTRSTAVVPNGVDTTAMPLRSEDDRSAVRPEALALAGVAPNDPRPLAVFIGSWHPPNLDAARLIIEIAPRHDVIFVLAGSHTLQFDQATVPPNVRLLPTFAEESLWPLLAGSDVALNPMVSGGGSNLKLYDYLAVGVPILTTPIGARGLEDPDSVVFTAEGKADALSAGLDSLLATPFDERKRRTTAGRLVAEQADWRLLGDRMTSDVLAPFGNHLTTAHPWPAVAKPRIADTAPPPNDATVELMNRIGLAALDSGPPMEMTTMNPNLREQLKAMAANRHAGRVLPHDARLKMPKKALIRAGQAITNEQLAFNEAALEVVRELSAQVAELEERLASIEDESQA